MDLKDRMKTLGFTEYEAKAYQTLLKEPAQTGYAVAKNSGVPRSKIYEVLEGLLAKGDVMASTGSPPLYSALAVSEMISKRRQETNDNLIKVEAELHKMQADSEDQDNIWNIKGSDAIIRKLIWCITNADERILLEIWAEDFPHIEAALEGAADRGVKITIVSYGEIRAKYAKVYLHDVSDEVTEEYGGRWVVFSCDDKQVIAGTLSLEDDNRAAWTKHPGLVMPITEVIIHDLYIAEIMKKHRDALESSFGKDLIKLRKKFMADPTEIKGYIRV